MKVLSIHYFRTPMFGVAPRAGHLRLFVDTVQDIAFDREALAFSLSGTSKGPDPQRSSLAATSLLQSVSAFLRDSGQPAVDTVIPLQVHPADGGHVVSLVFSHWDQSSHKHVLEFLIQQIGSSARTGEDATVTIPDSLHTLAQRPAPAGLNTQGLIKNAALLRLSCMQILPGEQILSLGTGKHSRRMLSTVTESTPALAMQMARDKHVMTRLLRSLGLPAPESTRVAEKADALEFFRSASGPVVVKPRDKDCGQGVFAGLQAEDQVSWAFDQARSVSPNLMVERHVEGRTHRLTIADGELIHARKRIPGGVTGDGTSSLAQLIAARNQEPEERRWRRKLGHERLALDPEATGLLASQGLAPDSIPGAGQFVQLRRKDNINAGGTSEILEFGDIHPDNIALARDAAGAIGLDIAGIDLISPDLGVSWKHNGAAVIEVNAMPQFSAMTTPEDHFRLFERLFSGNAAHVPYFLHLVPSTFGESDLMALARHTGTEQLVTMGGLVAAESSRPLPGAWSGLPTVASDRTSERIDVAMTVEQLVRFGALLPYVSELRQVSAELFTQAESRQVSWLLAADKACEVHYRHSAPAGFRWQPVPPRDPAAGKDRSGR